MADLEIFLLLVEIRSDVKRLSWQEQHERAKSDTASSPTGTTSSAPDCCLLIART
jgi:hypothetical protein